MIYYTAYDFEKLPKYNNRYRHDHKYYPMVCSFDIETTNIENKYAFMYIWMFGIGDDVVYGRTWDDLRTWLQDLRGALHLYIDHQLIVMVHYLKYDFGFFCSELNVDGTMIARSKHDVIMCTVDDVYEFRCSYAYTEMPLDRIGAAIGIPKITGFDYSKIRHSSTPLTADEKLYCETDARILTEFFKIETSRHGGVHKLPLTVTQGVKKMIGSNLSGSDMYNDRIMMGMIAKRQLQIGYQDDAKILRRLRCAFFGGFNYCTTMYKSQQIPNCIGLDRTSAYIYEILTKPFPADRFKRMPLPDDGDMMHLIRHDGIYRNMALLVTIEIKNLRTKLPDVGFLQAYRKNYLSSDFVDRRSMVTKKIMQIDHVVLTLTDIDLRLLRQYYLCDDYRIIDVYGTRYGRLPDYIIRTVLDLWDKKKSAKQRIKEIKKTREPTPDEQMEYDRIKSNLNRVYGIFVQDPIRNNYIWDNHSGSVIVNPAEPINTKNLQYMPVLYQWGVWVAAHARDEMLRIFGRLCMDSRHGKKEYNYRILYCDTDSVKGFDLDMNIIAEYNANVKRRVDDFCRRRHLDPERLEGLGQLEIEYYQSLKCIGQKQYAFISDKGEFVYHVSGLARPWTDDDGQKHSYFDDNFDTAQEKMDAFDIDMVIDAADSGIMSTVYGNKTVVADITDEYGLTDTVSVSSYVLLVPMAYHQSDDIMDLLQCHDTDRLQQTIDKFNKL